MRRTLTMFSVLAAAAVALTAVPAVAETVTVQLRGLEEVPANTSAASGSLRLFINDRAGTIDYELSYENLQGNVTQSHIHVGQAGVNGGISIWLCQTGTNPAPASVAALTPFCPAAGTVTGTVGAANVIGPTSQLVTAGELDEVIRALRAGYAYGNVHSLAVPGGEIRGQLH
jgi:hypothetical protein